MPTTNEALRDAALRHQIFLIRYGGGVARRAIAMLNRADSGLVDQIRRRLEAIDERGFDLGPRTTERLTRLLDAIRVQQREIGRDLERGLRGELDDLAGTEVDIAARRLNDAIGADLNILRPSPQMLRAAVRTDPFRGKVLRDWVAEMERAKVRALRDAIALGITEGQTIDDITRRIRGTRARQFRDGILEVSRRHAETIARTAVNHVATRAREMLYAENADIIRAVRWVSTLDGRTTPICQARDGRMAPTPGNGLRQGEAALTPRAARPPAHPNCRSTTVPVTKSWSELSRRGALKPGRGGRTIERAVNARGGDIAATRASMDGQVPARTSYGDWLRTQSVAFQDDVLGPARARLFRDGGLGVDRFVDRRTGRPFTLDELRSRDDAR